MSWATHIIEKLKTGAEVSFRPRGNSMTPHIKSGQSVTVKPFGPGEGPELGDIVLARVRGVEYLHFARGLTPTQVLIANARGRENGWTKRSSVYGKVVSVEA